MVAAKKPKPRKKPSKPSVPQFVPLPVTDKAEMRILHRSNQPGLTLRQLVFCQEYMVDFDAPEAAKRAGFEARMGARMLKTQPIKEELERMAKKRTEKIEITAEKVLQEVWNIATTDASAFTEHRIRCCRYCWGKEHQYQRTPAERRRDYKEYLKSIEADVLADKPVKPFDEQGGADYDGRKPPNPECPECFGEGEGYVYIKDTREVAPEARTLFAGAKVTKNGIEIAMHNKERALELLGKHLGLFTEKVEHSGSIEVVQMTPEQREARIHELLAKKQQRTISQDGEVLDG